MNKLIRIFSILVLIFISVFSSLYSYNSFLINILIIVFSSLFCFFTGRDMDSNDFSFKYIILYIFWNMNYLVFIKHLGTLNSFINTFLLKDVYIDLLATLAIVNIILLILKDKKLIKLIMSILFLICSIIFKNNIFLYVFITLIGNLCTFKSLFKIYNPIITTLDYLDISILILHRIFLFLLIDNKVISSNISDLLGTIVLIYVFGFCISYYLKIFPVIRKLI